MPTFALRRSIPARALAWLLAAFLGSAGARAQTMVQTLAIAARPQAAAVDPFTGRVYVVDSNTNQIVQIDARDPGLPQLAGATGSGPTAVAFNPADHRVYVASDGGVWVYDADNVADPPAKVTVGGNPFALVVDPGLNRVYVANQGSGTLSIIDAANLPPTGTPALAVPVGPLPSALALDPIRHLVYVAATADSRVTVVDGAAAGAPVATAQVDGLGTPVALAVDPVLDLVYVADQYGNQVEVLDGSTVDWANPAANAPAALVPVGGQPRALVSSPFTHRVYTADSTGNTVTVVQGSRTAAGAGTAHAVATVTVGGQPAGLALDALSGRLYVTNRLDGTVSVIDEANLPAAGVAAPHLATDPGPRAVAVDPLAGLAVALNYDGGSVSVLDGWAYRTTPVALAAGAQPAALDQDPLTGRVFAANGGAGTVTILGGSDGRTVLASPAVGAGPGAVAVDPVLGNVYVANAVAGTVAVLDADQPTAAATLVAVGRTPVALAADPASHRVFVANQADHTVSIIDGTHLAAAPATVALPSGPTAVAVDPVQGKVYAALPDSDQMAVLELGDPDAPPVLAAVGVRPVALAVDPVAGKVYVANQGDGTVTVLDATQAGRVLGGYQVGAQPCALAADPAISRVYAANGGGTTVSVLDGRALPITGGIVPSLSDLDVGGAPRTLAVDPFTGKVLVRVAGAGAGAADHVRVLDSSAVGGQKPDAVVGLGAGALVVNPGTGRAYTADPGSDRVTMIDLPNAQPPVPIAMAVTWTADPLNLPGGRLFVTRNASPQLSVTVTDSLAAGLVGAEPASTYLHFMVDDETGRTWDYLPPASPDTYQVNLHHQEPGLHTLFLVAVYGADSTTLGASTVGASPVTSRVLALPFVIRPLETVVGLASSAPLQVSGAPVALTATVTQAVAGSTNPPSGTVRFYDGSTYLGSGTLAVASSEGGLNRGSVTLSCILPPGERTIRAVYAGDSEYEAASASFTQGIYQTAVSVQAAAGDNQPASPVGTAFPVALQARVLDGNGVPVPGVPVTFAGTGLTFSATGLGADGALATDGIGTATVTATPTAAGQLTATATVAGLAPASFRLTATAPSAPADTRTGLALDGSPAFGQAVTLTATVTDAASGQPFAPAVPVIFLRDGVELGRAEPGADGTAVFKTSRLAPGAGALTARYPGDRGHGASESQPLAVQVRPGLLVTLAANPDLSLAAGAGAAFAVTVEAQGVGNVPFTVGITGLPRGAACAFSGFPATLPGTPVTGTATLTTTAAPPLPAWPVGGLGGGGVLLVGGLLAGRGRRRRTLGLLGCLLGLALLGGLQGCVVRGHPDHTPAGTYTLTLTAAAPGASPGSASLRLTVR